MPRSINPNRLRGYDLGAEDTECLLSTRRGMSQGTFSPLELSDLRSVIRKVVEGNDLTVSEAEFAFDVVMEGEASPLEMAALLTALRVKGEVPVEVAGGVKALRKAMIPIQAERVAGLIDTCGTGGGTVTTFNISTAAALVARGAGATIAKHGNRSFTSRSGSADVLEALGVRIELSPKEMERILKEIGLVFMFAPLLHPAMKYVGPVRRELGFTTIMNILGPLTNPARVKRQLVGVADSSLVPLVSQALRELGHVRALVVHGEAGLDELSPLGPSRVVELDDECLSERTVRPEDFGLSACPAEELAGGDPEENAEVIYRVLRGKERGGARTAIVLNAGAAIYVAGLTDTVHEGVEMAVEALDDGRALAALERLQEATNATPSK